MRNTFSAGDLSIAIVISDFNTIIIEKLLNDKVYCSILLQEISKNFSDSKKFIEKSLDKIFI